jgi:hypothetical protein
VKFGHSIIANIKSPIAKETIMNEVAKRQGTNVASPSANPFSEYGEAATHKNIVGELLKFSKGDWMYGQDNTDVPAGTQYIANMDELLIGWIRWEENKPTDHIMGKVSAGYQPPRRNELGDTEQNEWEVDDSGKPRDPWQLSNYMLVKGKADGELYTFTTGSKGGRDAIGDLCKNYGSLMSQHPKDYPVIAIGVRSYEHPNRSYGRIKTPEFKIVGWADKSAFQPDLGEVADEPSDEEAYDAPKPVKPAPQVAPNGKPKGRI